MGRRSTKENKSVYQVQRENCGMTREQASEHMTTISPEKLERMENEKSAIYPEDVLELSQAYKAPELCSWYCSHSCPIGEKTGRKVELKPLAELVISLSSAITRMNGYKDTLMEIAEDQKITDDEYEKFAEIEETLEKLALSADGLKLWVRKKQAEGEMQDYQQN